MSCIIYFFSLYYQFKEEIVEGMPSDWQSVTEKYI